MNKEELVKEIKELHQEGLNDREISDKLDISKGKIWYIRSRKLKLISNCRNGKKFICEVCKKEFIISPSRRNNKHIFCSRKCANIWRLGRKIPNREKKVIKICKNCSKEYKVIKYREDKSSYCSLQCEKESYKGSGNPNYKGGISPYYDNDEVWQNIRKEALERDNYKCIICNKERNLEVHHIIPYRLIGKHELDNLVTLCEDDHHKFEKCTVGLLKDYIAIGDPDFYRVLFEILMLHLRKNRDYGTKEEPLRNFTTVGNALEDYGILTEGYPATKIALAYAYKQWDAAFKLLGRAEKGNVEGVSQRLNDIAVYSIIARLLYERGL